MNKALKHYLNLNYTIEIKAIPEDEGGGFLARIPLFGELGIVGDGETIEEAVQELDAYKKLTFKEWLKSGKTIPEPEDNSLDKYSGRFVTRLPKYLHKELSLSAKENGVSLNSYVTTLLSSSFNIKETQAIVQGLTLRLENIQNTVKEIAYGKINCSVGSKNKPTEQYNNDWDYEQLAAA